LASRARSGDGRAVGELVEQVMGCLSALTRAACPNHTEAEDVLQESLLELTGSIASLKDDQALLPWLRRIVRNNAADRGRRRNVRREVSLEAAAALPAPAPEGDGALSVAERHRELLAALQSLPGEDRELLALRHEAGLSLEEIAAAVGQTPRAVESRLFRARRALRARLGERAGP
jgi:RNA polymerase sigma-70 factor (ECF subfamily)